MTKDQIITQLFYSKNFNDCIKKMEPQHLQEDLKCEVMAVVCEWPEEKITGLYERRELDFYVVRVILNMIKSSTSPFHKMYRLQVIEFNNHEQPDHCDKEQRVIREQLQEFAMSEINTLYWYDAELVRLYLELGSFRAIQQRTGIPFVSCYKNIKKSLSILRKRIESVPANPLFTKKEIQCLKQS